MDRNRDGNWQITRDEARVIKRAASLLASQDVEQACIHYLGVRLSSRYEIGADKLHINRRDLRNPFIAEAAHLPEMTTRIADSVSVYGFRYVYGELLARAGVELVKEATETNLYDSAHEQVVAENLINSYELQKTV